MATPPPATAAKVVPAIIVGGGRVGWALQDMGNGDDVLIKRGESTPPIFQGRFWFVQEMMIWKLFLSPLPSPVGANGMLEPWFQSKGLGDADQVLVYFAVSKLGEPPIDGKTDTNPEVLTAAYGKWASAIAASLHVLEKGEFQKQMLEKLIWICAFMLVGARYPGATVGVVEKEYRSEVSSLIAELEGAAAAEKGVVEKEYRSEVSSLIAELEGAAAAEKGVVEKEYRSEVSSLIAELEGAAAAEKGIVFDGEMEDRLCAYSRAVAHFPTAVKEFKWRNGWFCSLSKKAIAQGKPDPCPLHTAWLKELRVV